MMQRRSFFVGFLNESTMDQLAKGDYVIINGLQSDAGKKLNGGKGIILNKPTLTEDGVQRYPVLFYATKTASGGDDLVALDPTANKKIKAENLSPDPQDPTENTLLHEVAHRETAKLQAQGVEAMQKGIFWLEVYHGAWPDNLGLACNYASTLRSLDKSAEAFHVIKDYILGNYLSPSDPRYPHFCFDFSILRSKAGQQLSAALDYALQIPMDTPQHTEMVMDALLELALTCNRILQENPNEDNSQVAGIHVQACQESLKCRPESEAYMINLAAAYCMAGNNLEGARWYRRALAMPNPQFDVAHQTRNLMVAQLQCPGMPLEDHHVCHGSPSHVTSILKKDKEKWLLQNKLLSEGRNIQGMTSTMIVNSEEGGALIQHPMPSGPDDPEVFPEEFLKEIRP
ncbi:expressed unknown protein [Seminavis robusta]|uniref:Tetratricopeptide repeat protein n=1 Tax=Seminavis robusta TaxID=568900 RepID=A0A9N8ET56_9STRA|nr:expressed unknown protein [Seminavis robusta]|eukprot:Sro1748_g295100.1 n/a (400) ;mRNA; r:3453-4825